MGCGYMGRLHARTIAAAPGSQLVAAIDPIRERAESIAADFGGRVLDHLPQQVDAVVVATPTATHAEVAAPVLARGQWCLVEKPLAATAEQATALRSERLVVGHVERFNPAVRALGPARPSFVQARRLSPPGPRGVDADVVLDLMIHDLDLVVHWAGAARDRLEIVDAVGVSVTGRGWDVASVRLRSDQGLTASLTASRVEEQRERVVHLFEPGRYATLDLLRGVATTDLGALPGDNRGDALAAQWQAFTAAVHGLDGGAPRGDEALEALQLAERVREAMRTEPCA